MLKGIVLIISLLLWPFSAQADKGHTICLGTSHDETIAQCTVVIESNSSTRHNRFHALHERGTAHYRLNNFDAAVRDYSALIEMRPGTAALHGIRAHVLFDAERFAEAIGDLKIVLKSEPDNPVILRMRAQAYGSTDQFEDALRDWTRSIELAPEHDLAFLQRGATYIALGDFKAAQADSNTYGQRVPTDPLGHILRGSVLAELEDYDQALVAMDRAADLGGTDLVKNMQRHLRERGEYEGPLDGIYSETTRLALLNCLKDPTCRKPD